MDEMVRTREQVRSMIQSYDIAYKTLKEKMIKQILEKRSDILPEELIIINVDILDILVNYFQRYITPS